MLTVSVNVWRNSVWYKLAFRRYYVHLLIGAVAELRKATLKRSTLTFSVQ